MDFTGSRKETRNLIVGLTQEGRWQYLKAGV
jgi:hypothetical protein